jgi:DNA-binding GntR family transcriptional regulator
VVEEQRQAPLIEIAYRRIKADLIQCRILPGAEMFEAQLAAELRMSKTPVREALQHLVHEGFVSVSSRRSYRAAPITVADVQEIFELRMLLEPAAAANAASRATQNQIDELKALVTSRPRGDDELPSPRIDFHVALARASGNRRLARALEALLDETARLFHLLDVTDAAHLPPHAHRDLVTAIEQRDAEAARNLRLRDLEASRLAITEVVASGAHLNTRVELNSAVRAVSPDDPA